MHIIFLKNMIMLYALYSILYSKWLEKFVKLRYLFRIRVIRYFFMKTLFVTSLNIFCTMTYHFIEGNFFLRSFAVFFCIFLFSIFTIHDFCMLLWYYLGKWKCVFFKILSSLCWHLQLLLWGNKNLVFLLTQLPLTTGSKNVNIAPAMETGGNGKENQEGPIQMDSVSYFFRENLTKKLGLL